jgi:hypothetical protein
MTRRSIIGLLSAVACVGILAACNPIPSQSTAVRAGGVSRSGRIVYSSTVSGWLEVRVRTSADATVTVSAWGTDSTRADDPLDDCRFSTAAVPAWSDGSSLGYQRLRRIGPGTELGLSFTAPTPGTTFDARVVDDGGAVVGDLTHETPDPDFDSVWGAICA